MMDKEVATSSDEGIREKWRRWMVEIRNQIWMLQLDDYLYRGMLAVARANPEIEGQIFILRLENNFFTTQLMALRRLADRDSDVISFQTLFHHILGLLKERPPILTRAAFVDRYNKRCYRRPSKLSRTAEEFDKLVGPEEDFLSKRHAGEDRARLTRAYQKVCVYTNSVISHYNSKTMDQLRPGP